MSCVLDKLDQWANWLVNKGLTIFLVAFMVVVRESASAFDCVTFGRDARHSVLRDDPDIVCNDDDSAYKVRSIVSLVSLVCLGLIVVGIAFRLCCIRHKLHTNERVMRTYGALYLRYDKVCGRLHLCAQHLVLFPVARKELRATNLTRFARLFCAWYFSPAHRISISGR